MSMHAEMLNNGGACWDDEPRGCRACNNAGQGQVMFSFAILAVVVGIVVLFAHNWGVDTGPSIITKIKIFITHCQVGLAYYSSIVQLVCQTAAAHHITDTCCSGLHSCCLVRWGQPVACTMLSYCTMMHQSQVLMPCGKDSATASLSRLAAQLS